MSAFTFGLGYFFCLDVLTVGYYILNIPLICCCVRELCVRCGQGKKHVQELRLLYLYSCIMKGVYFLEFSDRAFYTC